MPRRPAFPRRPSKSPKKAGGRGVRGAIGVAGGFTDHAVESTVHIRHQGEVKEYELALDETVQIRPGDVVRVDQTVFWDVSSWLSPATSLALPLAYALKP